MFAAISIQNFRCFERFSLESLDRINLIAGRNNVGKTALLEALFLLLGGTNVTLIVNIRTFRGLKEFPKDLEAIRESLWHPLFAKFESGATIHIRGSLASGEEHTVELQLVPATSTLLPLDKENASDTDVQTDSVLGQAMQLRYTDVSGKTQSINMRISSRGIQTNPPPEQPAFLGIFLPARRRTTPQEDAERLGRLEMRGEPHDLVETLRIIEPRLKRLTTIVSGGISMIYGAIGLGRLVPLPLMGDGLGRLASLFLAIANAPHGVVLIDEIENGLHHSILTQVWEAIGDAARRFDTQIVATTHSFGCIQAAHEAFEHSEQYDFRLHRLERSDDTIQAITYDREALAAAMQADLEVR
jgi:hypothetical protein